MSKWEELLFYFRQMDKIDKLILEREIKKLHEARSLTQKKNAVQCITSFEEFETWVKVQMVYKKTTQKEVAAKIKTHRPRISEALHGKPSGKKYILPIIEELGGNQEDFDSILKDV